MINTMKINISKNNTGTIKLKYSEVLKPKYLVSNFDILEKNLEFDSSGINTQKNACNKLRNLLYYGSLKPKTFAEFQSEKMELFEDKYRGIKKSNSYSKFPYSFLFNYLEFILKDLISKDSIQLAKMILENSEMKNIIRPSMKKNILNISAHEIFNSTIKDKDALLNGVLENMEREFELEMERSIKIQTFEFRVTEESRRIRINYYDIAHKNLILFHLFKNFILCKIEKDPEYLNRNYFFSSEEKLLKFSNTF